MTCCRQHTILLCTGVHSIHAPAEVAAQDSRSLSWAMAPQRATLFYYKYGNPERAVKMVKMGKFDNTIICG